MALRRQDPQAGEDALHIRLSLARLLCASYFEEQLTPVRWQELNTLLGSVTPPDTATKNASGVVNNANYFTDTFLARNSSAYAMRRLEDSNDHEHYDD